MYCPRCGIQQTTETTRFCSRCGFQLAVTSQLLANNGLLPMPQQQPYPVVQTKQKPKGVKRGLMLLLASVVIFPIFFGGSIAADSPAPLIVPLTMFLAGLAWILYSYAFKDEVVPPQGAYQQPLVNPQFPQLPQPQNYGVSGFHQGNLATGELMPPTGEVVSPPSITEGTTTLFDKKS